MTEEMSKILVVDDDSGCRRLTSKVLSVFGYGSVSACNGEEALQVLEREQIDLVLLDLMMPVMDGLTFIDAMRIQPRWNNVPVVVISGVADQEMARNVRSRGANDMLVKSQYSIDDLINHVRAELTKSSNRLNQNAN